MTESSAARIALTVTHSSHPRESRAVASRLGWRTRLCARRFDRVSRLSSRQEFRLRAGMVFIALVLSATCTTPAPNSSANEAARAAGTTPITSSSNAAQSASAAPRPSGGAACAPSNSPSARGYYVGPASVEQVLDDTQFMARLSGADPGYCGREVRVQLTATTFTFPPNTTGQKTTLAVLGIQTGIVVQLAFREFDHSPSATGAYPLGLLFRGD